MISSRHLIASARQLGMHRRTLQRILAKLRITETGEDHRRVLAVLTFLDAR